MRTDREIYLLADKDYSQLSSAESRQYKYIMSLPFGERMDLISINNPANKYGNDIRGFTLMEKATGGKVHRGRPAIGSAEKAR
jgi:hypothetical protein